MAKTKSEVSRIHPRSSEQDIVQNSSQSEQQVLVSEQKVVQRIKPRYPSWPTSKPGPLSTSPLAGMRSINPFRPEQVTQTDYHQQTGQQSVDSLQHSASDASGHGPTSLDQLKTAQDSLGKRKQRL